MRRAGIAAAAAVAAFAASAGARVLNVPGDFATIGAAMHETSPGDTVFLAPGIYKEMVQLEDQVTLAGKHRDSVFIIGRENRPVVKAADRAVVRDLTIKSGSAGIRCENKVMTIENCVITENRETGIHCLVSLPWIRNNLIVRNDWTGIYCESAHGLSAVVEHNIIAENRYSGILLAGSSEIIIRNNIICNNDQYGIWVARESRRARVEYNVFHGNRHQQNQYAFINATNQTLDPSFAPIRAEVYDYASGPRRSLKQLGKDGADIGLLDASELAAQAADKDRDGVADAADQCPGVAEDRDGFQDEDGCPEFDNDNDGVYDSRDLCDNEAEDVDGFRDNDGCPDPDNDNDGVADSTDNCPDKPETKNEFKDDDGCPDEAPGK